MKNIIYILIAIIISNLTFASNENYSISTTNKSLEISAKVYPPKRTPKSIIYITPTISGVSPIETLNAKYFQKHGHLVIVPNPFKSEVESDSPSVEELDAEFMIPAENARIFIDLVKYTYGDLPVFALGASQGGFRSLIIASTLKDVKGAWIVTAGADFASIYANSKVEVISELKNKMKNKYGLISDQDYEQFLRINLKNDPANLCMNISIPFVQTIAMKDDKVPTINQIKLKEACPQHETIYLNVGHVQASLSTVYYRSKILKYFESLIK